MNTSSMNAFAMEMRMAGYSSTFDTSKSTSTNNNNTLNTDYKSYNATTFEFQMSVATITGENTTSQTFADFFKNIDKALKGEDGDAMKKKVEDEIDVYSTGYEGKPLTELTQEEAAALVAEDGFFGITNTSARVADFIIQAAGGDLEKLSAGREGLMTGFKWAEDLWGEELPEISYNTLTQTLKKVDEEIGTNGGSILDQQA